MFAYNQGKGEASGAYIRAAPGRSLLSTIALLPLPRRLCVWHGLLVYLFLCEYDYKIISADPVGIRGSRPLQKFGYGGLLWLGPHENVTKINLISAKSTL